MDITKRIGSNIRALREALGETQEDLGEAISDDDKDDKIVGKNTISYYENGKRKPSNKTLNKIAKHFMVSVEDLMNGDFTTIGKITIEKDFLWKNVHLILPIVSSEKALNNQHFKKAFDTHKSFYDRLHREIREENEKNIEICMAGYLKAIEDTTIEAEAAANYLALCFILGLSMLKQTLLKTKPAALMQLVRDDDKVSKIVDYYDYFFEADAEAELNETDIAEMEELTSEVMTVVKQSKDWSDLADYYLALRYVWNLVDNNMDWGFNQRVGGEMMKAFASVNNRYAARYLQISRDSLFGTSSQFVDDT